MPEPSAGGCAGGRTFHPQPKPRLSLALGKNDSLGSPLYENIEIGGKTFQNKEQVENQTEADKNESMATSTQNQTKRGSGRASTVRRSTLPVALPITHSSIPVICRNANTLENKVIATVSRPTVANRTTIQPSFLHNTTKVQSVQGSANSQSTQLSTIKCMPYNSPRLAKCTRLSSTYGVEQQNGHNSTDILETKRMGKVSKSVQPVTAKTTVITRTNTHHSSVNVNTDVTRTVINKVESAVMIKPSYVPQFRKQPVISKNGGPVTHRSTDRLLESSPLSCSADSLLGKENAVSAVSSVRNRTEYRKSASIPPQLVATLANQFNALIEHNQNAKQFNKSSAKVSALVSVRGGSQSCIATMVSSSTVAIRSCPSSPLQSSNLRTGRTQKQRVGNGNANNGRCIPKFQNTGQCKGSVSSKDDDESSDIEAICNECPMRNAQETQLLDTRENKLTIVQRAVRNYEGLSLTKCTSSPELPRKKIDAIVDLVPAVPRQSQTLPAAQVQRSYDLTRSRDQSRDAHTLPHLDWSAKPPYRRFTKVPANYAITASIPTQRKEPGKENIAGMSCKDLLPNTSGLALPNNSVKMKSSPVTKTVGPPLPQQRTSILDTKKKGMSSIYQNTSEVSQELDHICLESSTHTTDNPNEPNIFHARPATVVDKIQVRKLPEIPTIEKDSVIAKQESSNPLTCIMRSSLRRKAIFDKRPVLLSGDGLSVDGSESDNSAGSKCSMDLLAEIDNHPRILAAIESATKQRSSLSTQQSTNSAVEETMFKEPNASFLWKTSTQDKVSQESSSPPIFATLQEVVVEETDVDSELCNNTENQWCYEDDEEHLYEELANCISRSVPSSPPHHNIPLPLPELNEDPLIENVGSVISYSMQRNSLESHTSSSYEKIPDDSQDYSDASWTDDSDNNEVDEIQLRNKTKQKGRRPPNRKHLSRRSWSQSLRDLVGSQENGIKEHRDVAGCWEDEFGSDGSFDHVYQGSDQQSKTKETVGPNTNSITTDTDSDKSPTSGNGGSVSDVNQTDAEGRESKGKRVKRNWSWSKTDFHLDLTSKLGKIRMKKKTTTEICVETSSVDTSPTKKKQWPFKGRTVPKKGGQQAVSPKQSPKKESAQFYVPTFNSDGSLASPPGHMANLDIQAQAAVTNFSGSHVSLASSQDSCIYIRSNAGSNSNAAMKKSRRISSSGTLSRPKTAPPAPPISVIKFTSSMGPPAQNQPHVARSTSSEVSSDGTNDQDGTASQMHKPVQNSNLDQSQSSHIKYSSINLTNIGSSVAHSTSNISSDSEWMVSVVNRPNTRGSVASNYSGSSGDSHIRMDDVPPVPGAEGELMSRFLQTKPTIQESESDGATLGGSGQRRFLYLDDTYYIDNYRNSKLSPFEDEPLYQFYNINAQQRAAQENQVEGSDDDYESLYRIAPSEASMETVTSIPSAMDLVKSTEGGVRTLWCEVPEVISSGILETISPQERKLQEAMFEVITSEASYFKSLNVLINVFMTNPLFMDDYSMDCVLNKREKHVLFSDVLPVYETSERLLAALEKHWQENILLSDICDILQDHATKYFDVYVKYCSNQIYQDRCLKTLKETNPQFVELLRALEMRSECQSLSMYSFLMLPMQRITRLPLLVDAIFNRLDHGTSQYESCKQALMTLNKIVHECNEGAARMARMEEMLNISRLLDFREFKGIALISASRWLVKKGDLTRLLFCDPTKLSFGRRCTKQIVYLFLFTDLLIITKKKSDDCYNVVDYCPRNMVQVTEIESVDQLPDRPPDGCKNIFQLSMLQNHDNKTVEMFFCCPVESDRTRWMEAVTPKKSENPDERIYEEWDCPQVQAIHNYVAQQPDELSLEESDVVNVFRKTADGWYLGERIRDGIEGWFPSNYTVEIVSSHVRARNLRQRYRLLALSHSYLEEQKKKENKVK